MDDGRMVSSEGGGGRNARRVEEGRRGSEGASEGVEEEEDGGDPEASEEGKTCVGWQTRVSSKNVNSFETESEVVMVPGRRG